MTIPLSASFCKASLGLIMFQVWEVLTDYERLPEVVPNLAVCERVETPSGMSSRVTRLRQVNPCLAYVVTTIKYTLMGRALLMLACSACERHPSLTCAAEQAAPAMAVSFAANLWSRLDFCLDCAVQFCHQHVQGLMALAHKHVKFWHVPTSCLYIFHLELNLQAESSTLHALESAMPTCGGQFQQLDHRQTFLLWAFRRWVSSTCCT